MDIIVNSLYSDRSVFLRELTSNAADALDKRRFLSLSEADSWTEGEVKVEADKEKKTLTITDNGIGMTEEEVSEESERRADRDRAPGNTTYYGDERSEEQEQNDLLALAISRKSAISARTDKDARTWKYDIRRRLSLRSNFLL